MTGRKRAPGGRHRGGAGGSAHAVRPAVSTPLLVLGVVLAVFTLWIGPGLSSGSPQQAGPGATGGVPGASRGAAGTETGHVVTPPAATADPTAEAYRAVRPGDCLANHKLEGGWSSPLPVRVECSAELAFLRVTEVAASTAACPDGSGRSDWFYTSPVGRTTVLCVQREFRTGQCFAATLDERPGQPDVSGADLQTWLACSASRIPEPHNAVLMISDVLQAPRVIPERVCASGPRDARDYWWWRSNGGSVLVCATRPASLGRPDAGAASRTPQNPQVRETQDPGVRETESEGPEVRETPGTVSTAPGRPEPDRAEASGSATARGTLTEDDQRGDEGEQGQGGRDEQAEGLDDAEPGSGVVTVVPGERLGRR